MGLNDVVVRERDGVRDPSSSDCLTVSQSMSHAWDARWTVLVFEILTRGQLSKAGCAERDERLQWVCIGPQAL